MLYRKQWHMVTLFLRLPSLRYQCERRMPPKTKKKTRSILKIDSFDEEQTIAPDCRCISTSLGLSHLHFSLHNFLTFPSFPHFSHPSTDFSHPQTKNLHPLGWRQQRIKLYQFGSLHISVDLHELPCRIALDELRVIIGLSLEAGKLLVLVR